MALTKAEAIARRILADENRVITPAIIVGKRVAIKIRQQALTSYRYGRPILARNFFISEMLNTVVTSMVLMHAQGEKLARDLQTGLKFAAEDSLAKMLEKLVDGRRRNALAARYKTNAIKVLDTAGAKIERKLRKTVNDLIIDREPLDTGIVKLSEAFNELGLTVKSDYQLEAIFRTQSQIAYNAGRWQADQDPDIQEILWGYEYTTVGDNRVRPSHAALNGVRLPKDDPFWKTFWPPNGYSCRCAVIPIYEVMEIKRAPKFVPDTDEIIRPDKGFDFNPGLVLAV